MKTTEALDLLLHRKLYRLSIRNTNEWFCHRTPRHLWLDRSCVLTFLDNYPASHADITIPWHCISPVELNWLLQYILTFLLELIYSNLTLLSCTSAASFQNLLIGTDYLVMWGVYWSTLKPRELFMRSSEPSWYQTCLRFTIHNLDDYICTGLCWSIHCMYTSGNVCTLHADLSFYSVSFINMFFLIWFCFSLSTF